MSDDLIRISQVEIGQEYAAYIRGDDYYHGPRTRIRIVGFVRGNPRMVTARRSKVARTQKLAVYEVLDEAEGTVRPEEWAPVIVERNVFDGFNGEWVPEPEPRHHQNAGEWANTSMVLVCTAKVLDCFWSEYEERMAEYAAALEVTRQEKAAGTTVAVRALRKLFRLMDHRGFPVEGTAETVDGNERVHIPTRRWPVYSDSLFPGCHSHYQHSQAEYLKRVESRQAYSAAKGSGHYYTVQLKDIADVQFTMMDLDTSTIQVSFTVVQLEAYIDVLLTRADLPLEEPAVDGID